MEAKRLVVAALVQSSTPIGNRWLVERLGMGHQVDVTRAVRTFRDDPQRFGN